MPRRHRIGAKTRVRRPDEPVFRAKADAPLPPYTVPSWRPASSKISDLRRVCHGFRGGTGGMKRPARHDVATGSLHLASAAATGSPIMFCNRGVFTGSRAADCD